MNGGLRSRERQPDYRPVARAALKDLHERVSAAVQQTKDPMTLAHLQDCQEEIDQILHPKK